MMSREEPFEKAGVATGTAGAVSAAMATSSRTNRVQFRIRNRHATDMMWVSPAATAVATEGIGVPAGQEVVIRWSRAISATVIRGGSNDIPYSVVEESYA